MAWLHLHGHNRHLMDKSNCSVAVAAAAASEAIVTSVTTVIDINTFLRVPPKGFGAFMAATTSYGVEEAGDVPHGDGFILPLYCTIYKMATVRGALQLLRQMALRLLMAPLLTNIA